MGTFDDKINKLTGGKDEKMRALSKESKTNFHVLYDLSNKYYDKL